MIVSPSLGIVHGAFGAMKMVNMKVIYRSWYVVCAIAVWCIVGCQQPPSKQPGLDGDASIVIAAPLEVELAYDDFDQSPGHGWRALADNGKYVSAGALIDTYLEHRKALEDWQRLNLQFHAGQMYAFAGENETALLRFKASINLGETEESPIRWNAYVRATIAFLEEDYDQLLQQRATISAGPRIQGKVPNLDVVDRLIRNFHQPYASAYTTPQE
jgi:hypothetical protein